jgi:hypothetical protein
VIEKVLCTRFATFQPIYSDTFKTAQVAVSIVFSTFISSHFIATVELKHFHHLKNIKSWEKSTHCIDSVH